jgi:hypothetical protein
MSGTPHDHDRPGVADMRAALLVTRAILVGADDTAHTAAGGGSCPACTVMAGISYMITAYSTAAGDTAFVSEPVRQQLLAAVDATRRELDSGSN